MKVRHVSGDVIENLDDDYPATSLLVFFDRHKADAIKLAAAAAHMSVSDFVHRAVAEAVARLPVPGSPTIGTINPAAARPANRSDD